MRQKLGKTFENFCPLRLCKMWGKFFRVFRDCLPQNVNYSHWLGVPDILSVVVSRTVIVTCRPDFGFPSALSCGTAYTGLTLRALLNSSSRLSTDGLWIWSMMSCDSPALPFTGAAFDWLTSTESGKNQEMSKLCGQKIISHFLSIELP